MKKEILKSLEEASENKELYKENKLFLGIWGGIKEIAQDIETYNINTVEGIEKNIFEHFLQNKYVRDTYKNDKMCLGAWGGVRDLVRELGIEEEYKAYEKKHDMKFKLSIGIF